jgi:hypothetical protein
MEGILPFQPRTTIPGAMGLITLPYLRVGGGGGGGTKMLLDVPVGPSLPRALSPPPAPRMFLAPLRTFCSGYKKEGLLPLQLSTTVPLSNESHKTSTASAQWAVAA